jgi:hypothetical protein
LYWLLCLAVLCWVYPIGDRIRLYRSSLSRVLPEYVIMSFLVMCLVVLAVPLVTWWCNRLVIWISVVIRTAITLVSLWVFATYMDTREFKTYWLTSQLTSFFSELRVVVFAYAYTPIVSVLAGVYYTWIGRRKATPPPSPERYPTRGEASERSADVADDPDPQIRR